MPAVIGLTSNAPSAHGIEIPVLTAFMASIGMRVTFVRAQQNARGTIDISVMKSVICSYQNGRLPEVMVVVVVWSNRANRIVVKAGFVPATQYDSEL